MQNKKLYLTNFWITSLFAYYLGVLIIGIFLSLSALLPNIFIRYYSSPPIMFLSLVGAIGMSLNGSSIFYIRKLYKLCFHERLIVDDRSDYIRKLGTTVYFLARPIFSIGFSILVVVGIHSGYLFTTTGPVKLNSGFLYLTMIISFFSGFLSGRFVKELEKIGDKLMTKISK